MICYHCGCNLTEHDFCTNCGVDVSSYKIVVSASNIFYNEGLEKAKVRDLSGAVASLRQCLKLNKNQFLCNKNVQADNSWSLLEPLITKCISVNPEDYQHPI